MITVLRLGHRIKRDERLSTHCGLVARAFGADEIIYCGKHDEKILKTLSNINEKWGNDFEFKFEKDWEEVIERYRKKKFVICQLTMYGLPIQDIIKRLRNEKRVLLIVGGEKVPGKIYGLVDFNIAVTNQPHSEIAALSLFLHEYFQGKELNKKFSGAKLRIVPQKKGKKVIKYEGDN